jgi:hypothetical protein
VESREIEGGGERRRKERRSPRPRRSCAMHISTSWAWRPPPTIRYVGGGHPPSSSVGGRSPRPSTTTGASATASWRLRACRRTLPTSSVRMQTSRASCTAAYAQKTPPCCWRGVTPTTADDGNGGSPPRSLLADNPSMTTPGRHRRRSPPRHGCRRRRLTKITMADTMASHRPPRLLPRTTNPHPQFHRPPLVIFVVVFSSRRVLLHPIC